MSSSTSLRKSVTSIIVKVLCFSCKKDCRSFRSNQNSLKDYNSKTNITFDDILDFHVRFKAIHLFQDGNGRVGRLIMFKECLKHNIVPFIITEELKLYYYRVIKNWKDERGFLRTPCLTGQDTMKESLNYFEIKYE